MSTSIDRSSCSESQLSPSEIMQRALRDFQGFKKILEEDDSERAVQNVMDSLSEYRIDEHLPGSVFIFFMETVSNLCTPTHKDLLDEFTVLIRELENAIQIQRQKEVEIIQAAQQSNEDTHPQQNEEGTQPQPNEEGAKEEAQPSQDAESTQSQQGREDIQAKQHEANVRFVEAMFKVLLMNADLITRLFEESMK